MDYGADLDFAPTGERAGLVRVADVQPTGSLDVLGEQQVLQRRLVGAEDVAEGGTAQIGRQRRILGRVLDFQVLALARHRRRLERVALGNAPRLELLDAVAFGHAVVELFVDVHEAHRRARLFARFRVHRLRVDSGSTVKEGAKCWSS